MAIQKRNTKRAPRDRGDRDMLVPRKRVKFMEPGDIVDINNVEFLRKFVTEYGKIVPARLSGVTAAQQRQIKQGVRRARNMGLMA